MSWQVIHGDCRSVLPSITADAIVTDPPYGMTENSHRRLHAYRDPEKSKGRIGWSNKATVTDYGDTTWNHDPLDADTWTLIRSVAKEQIVFGLNHLWSVLGKPGRILAWDKKCKNGWVDTFSDFEMAYCSSIGPDRLYRQLWMGMLREGEKEPRFHPTQKPIALMEWAISILELPEGATIVDPYMGSGTTGVAAVKLGFNFIGIEKEAEYVEIARKRIGEVQLPLFAGGAA